MNSRNTIIVLILLIALSAYVYFAEWNKPAPSAQTTPTVAAIGLFPKIETADVVGINIHRGDKTVDLEKHAAKWQFVVPANGGQADTSKVNGGISVITLVNAHRSFGSVQNFAQYGLSKPMATIDIVLKDGSQHTLLIGAPTLDGGSYYVQKKGVQEVYLVYKSAIDSVLKWATSPPYPPTPTPTATVTKAAPKTTPTPTP